MPEQFVAVSAFIPFRGKALVLQRAEEEKFLPLYWEQAGGKVEFGESPMEAVVREVLEETGVAIEPLTPYHTHSYIMPDGRHMIEVAIRCKPLRTEPQIILSPDHTDFRWASKEELSRLSPMSPQMRRVIEKGF